MTKTLTFCLDARPCHCIVYLSSQGLEHHASQVHLEEHKVTEGLAMQVAHVKAVHYCWLCKAAICTAHDAFSMLALSPTMHVAILHFG